MGVAVVGRPSAPALQNGVTFEVTRSATRGDDPAAKVGGHASSVASRLLGACWAASRALGVRRLVSYTRFDEAGTSYRAAGWHRVVEVEGREWTGGNKSLRWLPGLYAPTTEVVDRVRWEIGPDCACEACARVRTERAKITGGGTE